MRIGLLGWHAPTGIGYMNLDMYQLGFADTWLAPRHPKLGIAAAPPGAGTFIPCELAINRHTLASFLDSIDILVLVERPFLQGVDIWAECRKRKILTCCIPMLEFFPAPMQTAWTAWPDCVWSVNKHTTETLSRMSRRAQQQGLQCRWKNKVLALRWGVNLQRFPFHQQTRCTEFLFLNGWGGTQERKGADIVARAACLSPTARIRVLSQTRELPDFPSNVTVDLTDYANPADMYRQGNVLLLPSRWEGLGLQLWEAYASGLPVIVSNAPPMSELPHATRIDGLPTVRRLSSALEVAGFEPAFGSLAAILAQQQNMELTAQSKLCRKEAEKVDLTQQFAHARTALSQWATDGR